MYRKYSRDSYSNTSRVDHASSSNRKSLKERSQTEPRGYRPFQDRKSNSILPVRDFPYHEKTAMGNTLRSTRENASFGKNYSSSNSVSQQEKPARNFEYGVDPLPTFAGKSSQNVVHSPSTLNNNVDVRRNSSDSGYNSSGKFSEPRNDTGLICDGLQRINLNNNKLCGESDYSQFNKAKSHTNDITLPSCISKTTPSSTRSSSKTSLDLHNPKPRSYVNDRTVSSKSPMSESEGLVGLQNLGNTCFMNSILQCLSHCRPLRDKILSGGSLEYNKQSKMKGKLYSAFADLIKIIWSSRSRTSNSVSPQSFKTQIQRFSPRFMGYEQQDSQEFLRFLLEGLNEDLNQAARRSSTSRVTPDLNKLSEKDLANLMWKQYMTKENSLVTDLFCGQIMSTLTCTKCHNRSVTYDPFWDLSLSIPRRPYNYRYTYTTNSVNLSDCLMLFTKKEELDGDEKPKCEKCKTRQKCEKQIKIHRFPKILVIHLKRFSGFGFRSKLQTDVDFPLSHLDMSEFASEYSEEFSNKDSSGVKYNLFAVSNHIGSAFGGHYTAYCKHSQSKEWHSFNDSRVAALPSSNVGGSQAYVLFYELD